MVKIDKRSDQNKDSAAEESRYHDFGDIIYDIDQISNEKRQRILKIENPKLVQCFLKNSNLSLITIFEEFDMSTNRWRFI